MCSLCSTNIELFSLFLHQYKLKLYQFNIFYTSSKTNCSKVKIELQQIYLSNCSHDQSAFLLVLVMGFFKILSEQTKTIILGFSGSFCCIPVYLGVIPAGSIIFQYHSCSFRFIPVLFCLIPVYSDTFRSVPFRSLPVLFCYCV